MRCVYLAAKRSLPSVRLFLAAPSVRSTLSLIRLSAASAKTSLTPAAVPDKWCQNRAMRRCFEMHIRPKRCKRDTASWPGPQAGGDVISFVLREMQGPARERRRRDTTARGLSCDREDGVEAARHRIDAVTATTSCVEHCGRSTRSESTQNLK